MAKMLVVFLSAAILKGTSVMAMTPTPNTHSIPRTFNFHEALQYSLDHSPVVNSAFRQFRISEFELENATFSFLPSLDLTATHGLQKDSLVHTSNPWKSDLTLGATENLYDNGADITRYRASKLKKVQAEITYHNERDKLLLSVAEEFLNFSLLSKLLDVLKEQEDVLKKQYDSAAYQYRQGLKTRKDYLRFKTELNRVQMDLLDATTNIEKSRRELGRLMALPVENSADQISFEPVELSEDSLKTLPVKEPNIHNHYEYRIAKLQNQIDSLSVDLARRKYWPQLYLTGGATYENYNYIYPTAQQTQTDHITWNTLLTVQFNLWDWGTLRRNLREAQEQQQIQTNTTQLTILNVSSDIHKLLLDLQEQKQNFKLSQELLEMEKNSYELLENEYQNGKVPYLDLITEFKDLSDAKNRFYTALYKLKQESFTYDYHEGTLYDSLFKK